MKKLILIKLGGSLITDKNKPYTANFERIKNLAQEIHEILHEGKYQLVVGHGGGSFPHVPAKLYQTQKGFINDESPFGMALVQDAASQLNRIVVKKFLENGIKAVSINPSSSFVAKNGIVVDWYLKPLIKLLINKMLPVVYGDAVLDEKKGCAIVSTERLLNYLAINLPTRFLPEKIIYLGDTDGVWDKNKKIIPVVTPKIYDEMKASFGGSHGIDVTGGMEHKMSEAIAIAKTGVEVVIANGNKPGTLTKIIKKEKVSYTIIRK